MKCEVNKVELEENRVKEEWDELESKRIKVECKEKKDKWK